MPTSAPSIPPDALPPRAPLPRPTGPRRAAPLPATTLPASTTDRPPASVRPPSRPAPACRCRPGAPPLHGLRRRALVDAPLRWADGRPRSTGGSAGSRPERQRAMAGQPGATERNPNPAAAGATLRAPGALAPPAEADPTPVPILELERTLSGPGGAAGPPPGGGGGGSSQRTLASASSPGRSGTGEVEPGAGWAPPGHRGGGAGPPPSEAV